MHEGLSVINIKVANRNKGFFVLYIKHYGMHAKCKVLSVTMQRNILPVLPWSRSPLFLPRPPGRRAALLARYAGLAWTSSSPSSQPRAGVGDWM